MIKLQEKSQTKKLCISMQQNKNIGVLHYKCMPLIRKWGEGRWRHVMSECRFRHGLCFSGTNLGGTQKNLQSFGAAAISASLLLPRLFLCVHESLCHPVVLCIAILLRIIGMEPPPTLQLLCKIKKTLHVKPPLTSVLLFANHFLPKGYQCKATTKTRACICCISTPRLDTNFLTSSEHMQFSWGLISCL